MTDRTPASDDPEAIPATRPLRYDWQAEGAVDAIRPTIDRLARICDRIAQRKAQSSDSTEPARKAS